MGEESGESGKVTGHEREGGPRSTKTDEDKRVIFTFYDSFVFFSIFFIESHDGDTLMGRA